MVRRSRFAYLLYSFVTHVIAEVVLLHLHSTLLEVTLSSTFLHTNQIRAKQRNCLTKGLDSLKSWFAVFFSIPPADYIGFPFSIFSQLIRCLKALYQLKTLDLLAWGDVVWDLADPLLILDRVISNMKQVTISAGLRNAGTSEDIFSPVTQVFLSLRPEWETRLQPADMTVGTASLSPLDTVETSLLDSFGMNFFDDDWLTNALSYSSAE